MKDELYSYIFWLGISLNENATVIIMPQEMIKFGKRIGNLEKMLSEIVKKLEDITWNNDNNNFMWMVSQGFS